MSVLTVGLSHHSAPVGVLERAALTSDQVGKLLDDVASAPHVTEAAVLATCNRTEVYAEVEKFHAGVADVSGLLAQHCGVTLDELTPHLYVHYEDRAVQHLFSVASGLDSMVVGEGQILGQVRDALARAQQQGAIARTLNELFQQALRAGKRAHAETGIDRAGQSLVTVGLEQAGAVFGSLAGRTAVVVGAGSMSALAAATLNRAGVGAILVANRTPEHAERLAATVNGRAVPFGDLPDVLDRADIVICSTGAAGIVVPGETVAESMRRRGGRPLFILDLALPRDVDPAARSMAGVTLVDLERLAVLTEHHDRTADVEAVRRIVAEEVRGFADWQHASRVTPTVTALRSMAAEVVDAELARLAGRLPELDQQTSELVAQTVRRVVDKLLHAPTVRVKELAGMPGGTNYAAALRELFGLDPTAVDAVSRAEDAPAGTAAVARPPGPRASDDRAGTTTGGTG
jgi:glutamyl-tRNA reductase